MTEGSHSHGTAEAVRIHSDENGWELHVLTDDGWHLFNIHGEAESLVAQTKPIIAWLQEGYDAARSHIPPAGGMTHEEILDVYRDDPGKMYGMLRELDR